MDGSFSDSDTSSCSVRTAYRQTKIKKLCMDSLRGKEVTSDNLYAFHIHHISIGMSRLCFAEKFCVISAMIL